MEVAVMGTHTIHSTSVPTTRAGSDFARLLFTLVGGAALIVSAFLNWTRGIDGDNLSNHALVRTEFFAQSDIVKTVGGIAVLIGLIALLGLVDRTGWLTRLAGALGIVLFVLFAVEVYRSSQHTMQVGAWLALAGGIVLVIGGFFGAREVVEAPTVVEERSVVAPPMETRDPRMDPRMDPRAVGTDAETETRRQQL
jgi:hypothetical protein